MDTKHNCKVKRVYGKPFRAYTSFLTSDTPEKAFNTLPDRAQAFAYAIVYAQLKKEVEKEIEIVWNNPSPLPRNLLLDLKTSAPSTFAETLKAQQEQKQGLQDTETGKDPYVEHAASLFRVDEKDVTAEQRQIAKRRLFGVRYGMTGTSLEKLLTSKPPSVEEMKRALGFINLKTEMINLPPELIPHFDFNALKDNLSKIVDFKFSPKEITELGEQRQRYIQAVGRGHRILSPEDVIFLYPTPRFPHSWRQGAVVWKFNAFNYD